MKLVCCQPREEPPVTEADWLACTDAQKMLEYLRGRASDRKLRLFACGGCRRIWQLLSDEWSRQAVEIAEMFADGLASMDALRSASDIIWDHVDCLCGPVTLADEVAACTAEPMSGEAAASGILTYEGVLKAPCDLFLDIFGNPFRPVALNPAWLSWHGGTIPKLAQTIYENRALPSGHLDHHRLAVLTDALEDAGCTDRDILGHCRGAGAACERMLGCGFGVG
jgi:hypothetical protein